MNFLPGSLETDGAVKIGNITLKCPATGLETGAQVTAAIRPEDINAQDIKDGDENVFGVEVKYLEFLGSFYRASLGGPALDDRDIYADFSINLVRRKHVKTGSMLRVRIPPDLIRIYARN